MFRFFRSYKNIFSDIASVLLMLRLRYGLRLNSTFTQAVYGAIELLVINSNSTGSSMIIIFMNILMYFNWSKKTPFLSQNWKQSRNG